MDTLITSAVAFSILLLVIVLAVRGVRSLTINFARVQKLNKKTGQWTPHVSPYGAVTVSAMPGSCEAVIQLAQQRFLVSEAPMLPLPECAAERCKCKYVRYQDRRDPAYELRVSLGDATSVCLSLEHDHRRRPRGRRRADWAMV